jgi:thiol-disulfide isomerase/thioredoxin
MSTPKSRRREKGKGVSRVEIIVGLVILFLVVWGGYSLSQPSPSSTSTTLTTPTSNSGASDFTLPVVGPNGLTGEKVSLSSFRGKVVLLEFMVPWCPHCQNMGPVLENLYKQYGPQNVVFLSVSGAWPESSGGPPASTSDAAKFIQTYGSTWTYVYDSSNTVFNNYGVNSTPTFFIIDKNGRVAYTFQGEVASDTLAADLSRLNA